MLGVDPTAPPDRGGGHRAAAAPRCCSTPTGWSRAATCRWTTGIARLTAALAELADRPLDELCDEVIERLRPEGLQDDVALVAVRLHPEDRPRPAGGGPAAGARPRRSAADG